MTSGKRTGDSRLSVRLTPEERLELERRAGGVRLSEYVRRSLLGSFRDKNRDAPIDQKQRELAQILGLLGQSGAFQALVDLSEGMRIGALPADEETKEAILAARTELAEIKTKLMRALRTKAR